MHPMKLPSISVCPALHPDAGEQPHNKAASATPRYRAAASLPWFPRLAQLLGNWFI